MKAQTKIIAGMPNETKEIDWEKRQWVISKHGDIILCTGNGGSEDMFYGVCIKDRHFETGDYDLYSKALFTPITTTITIEIYNTND